MTTVLVSLITYFILFVVIIINYYCDQCYLFVLIYLLFIYLFYIFLFDLPLGIYSILYC